MKWTMTDTIACIPGLVIGGIGGMFFGYLAHIVIPSSINYFPVFCVVGGAILLGLASRWLSLHKIDH